MKCVKNMSDHVTTLFKITMATHLKGQSPSNVGQKGSLPAVSCPTPRPLSPLACPASPAQASFLFLEHVRILLGVSISPPEPFSPSISRYLHNSCSHASPEIYLAYRLTFLRTDLYEAVPNHAIYKNSISLPHSQHSLLSLLWIYPSSNH